MSRFFENLRAVTPAFDWETVILSPWRDDPAIAGWTILMGFAVTATLGLIGNYLLLRRLALVGDAISHSILPGLVVTFMIFKHSSTWVAFLGAAAAGIVTVILIEFIHKQSRLKSDAAICIAFTLLFAIGVVLMSNLESKGTIHIDADCVLYGEIAFVPLEPPAVWFGRELGPQSVMRMLAVLVATIGLTVVFYKELLITAFDANLAQSLGFRTGIWHYGLMTALALAVVCAFESVGAILAVAMLIIPPMFAGQLSDRLPVRLCLTVVHAALSALTGYHLSVWLNCSAAGAMVTAAAAWFVAACFATAIASKIRRSAIREHAY